MKKKDSATDSNKSSDPSTNKSDKEYNVFTDAFNGFKNTSSTEAKNKKKLSEFTLNHCDSHVNNTLRMSPMSRVSESSLLSKVPSVASKFKPSKKFFPLDLKNTK